MTFWRAAFALLSCACVQAPPKVTVTSAIPRPVEPVTLPEKDEDFGCGVYAKDGISENAETFRACVERVVAAETPCEGGGSPDLATLELAAVLVDGSGGPADIPRARNILEGCFRDVAVDEVLQHADKKQSDPRTPSFGKCDDFAQTTISSIECLEEHLQNERAWLRRERRSYSASTRPLFDTATLAADKWERTLGGIDYARYAGGTMRNPAMLSRVLGAMKDRRASLAAIRTWSATSPTAAMREETRAKLANALRLIENGAELDELTALHDEEHAWSAYRDAEAALYEALHPGTRAEAMFALAERHSEDMCSLVEDP